MMNYLIRGEAHAWLRAAALDPAVSSHLESIVAYVFSDDRPAHVDLADLVPRIQVALSAAMIGVSVTDRTGAFDELMGIVNTFREMAGVRWVIDPQEKAAILERAAAAKRALDTHFFRPALEARRATLALFAAGAIERSALPRDFVTLVAAHAEPERVAALEIHQDPDIAEPEAALREAIATLIIGAVDTTSFTVMWAVSELTDWFASVPQDQALRTDDAFLLGVVHETLRLHAVHPAFMREATEDVALSDGTTIRAGEMVALRTGLASRDRTVFGEDADRFDPRRTVDCAFFRTNSASSEAALRCVMHFWSSGNHGDDGSLVHILRELYRAGMRPDPADPPRRSTGTYHPKFTSYPVLMGPEDDAPR